MPSSQDRSVRFSSVAAEYTPSPGLILDHINHGICLRTIQLTSSEQVPYRLLRRFLLGCSALKAGSKSGPPGLFFLAQVIGMLENLPKVGQPRLATGLSPISRCPRLHSAVDISWKRRRTKRRRCA